MSIRIDNAECGKCAHITACFSRKAKLFFLRVFVLGIVAVILRFSEAVYVTRRRERRCFSSTLLELRSQTLESIRTPNCINLYLIEGEGVIDIIPSFYSH